MKVYGSVAGMIAQLNKIDLISNNVANINTTSFKEKLSNTHTFTREENISQYPKKNLPFEKNSERARQFILNTFNSLPIESEVYKNETQGSFKQTNNDLDFALNNKNNFFLVKNKDGEKYLTRDGSFKLNENGIVVTNNDEYVLSKDSDLLTMENIKEDIGVFKYKYTDLKNVGDNMYGYGKLPDPEERSELLYSTGYLETSNVNGIQAMTKLIGAQRLFDQLKSVVDTQQDMGKKSNTNIGDHQA